MRRARSAGKSNPLAAPMAMSTPTMMSPPKKRRKNMVDAFQSLTLKPDMTPPPPPAGSDASDDEQLLSAQQLATKELMYKLAFGRDQKPKNTVDAKLEEMIRQTRLKATRSTSRDDFHVDAPYGHDTTTMEVDTMPGRRRSNSLPYDWQESSTDDVEMDLS